MNPLASLISEATFQRQVTDLCDLLGLFRQDQADTGRTKRFKHVLMGAHIQ